MSFRAIDTHCHLDFPEFDADRKRVLATCQASGVVGLVVPSTGSGNWRRVLRLCDANPGIYGALGIHPCFLKDADEGDLDELAVLIRQNRKKLAAIGETGLDRSISVPVSVQTAYFVRQLIMASDCNLPVIVHSRRMNDEVAACIRKNQVKKGVIHGFSGSLQQAENFWSLGFRLGVGGVITYPRAAKTRKAVAEISLQALILETDAPDMPVCGFQGQRNSPERLPLIFSALCEIRSEAPEEIENQLLTNSMDTFSAIQFNA